MLVETAFRTFQAQPFLWSVVSLYATYSIVYLMEEWKLRNIPSPSYRWIPFFGPLFHLIKFVVQVGRMGLDYPLQEGNEYGLMMLIPKLPFFQRRMVVADPQSAEYMLKTNFENYIKGERLHEMLLPLFGDGIFNVDGSSWKKQRQVASHMFKVKEMRHMVTVFQRHANTFLDILQQASESGRVIDFQDLFARVTLDSIGEIAFGIDIGSLKDESIPFARAFNGVQISISERFRNPTWFIKRLRSVIPSEVQLREGADIINEFAFDIIQKRKKDTDLEHRGDLLSQYLLFRDENGQPFDDSYLRDIVVNFLTAGRDTTSATLTFAAYLLSQNPRVEAKLLEEINRVLKDSNPDYENVKSMSYLTAFIDETLRIFPPVPYDPKEAVQDDIFPNGMAVKAGTMVSWSALVMGRSEKLWDQPLECRPERWLGENGGIPVEAINFIPFQAGPRVCLGKSMAYLEVKIVLIMMLRRFHLRLVENRRVNFQPSVTLYSKYGMKMVVEKQN